MVSTPDPELGLRYQAKGMLRKRARALRNSMPKAGLVERSRLIAERLFALPEVERAASVALFYPITARNEVDVLALFGNLAHRKSLYFPSIEDVPDDEPLEERKPPRMTFRRVVDVDAMNERGLGFRDPGPEAPEAVALDVIVVPGLQFDTRGHRLGYGAGYYDRTLPRFAPPATTIGVAFDFQLIAEVPETEGDVPVDFVVTDRRTFAAER